MNAEPQVSCITIFFNAERFLDESIRSVLAQTHTHWELLLVDDGSSDASSLIARRYAAQNPDRIRYLHHSHGENRGMSASRNLGLAHARGSFIAFLDADDVWLPQKLERQLQLLHAHPEAGFVFGPSQMWYSWAGDAPETAVDFTREIGVPPDILYTPPSLAALIPLDQAKTPATCSVLIRRTVFEKTGGFIESFRGMFEDQAFFAKVLLKTPAYVTSECLDKYRQHPHSCCATSIRTGHYNPYAPNPAQADFLFWFANYLREEQIMDPQVLEPLNNALWPYRHPLLYRLKQLRLQPRTEILRYGASTLRKCLPNFIYTRLRDGWRRVAND